MTRPFPSDRKARRKALTSGTRLDPAVMSALSDVTTSPRLHVTGKIGFEKWSAVLHVPCQADLDQLPVPHRRQPVLRSERDHVRLAHDVADLEAPGGVQTASAAPDVHGLRRQTA